jgi:hypothetical protein
MTTLLVLFRGLISVYSKTRTTDTQISSAHGETCLGRVRKTAKSDYYVRHVSLSVRPHATTRLPLDGF